jgi:LPXTG-site transpeptidase (sortase) family protein
MKLRKNTKILLAGLTAIITLAVSFFIVRVIAYENKLKIPIESKIYDSLSENIIGEDAEKLTPQLSENPDSLWENLQYDGNFTLPEKAVMQNGSTGILTIPRIGVSANVFENEDVMEAMSKGAAHFPSTSNWNGNVGLSAHNWTETGAGAYFKSLKYLEKGDELIYETALGIRTYVVSSIQEINQSDWSLLGRTEDNRLTLITCVNGKPDKRLCVQAIEKI